MASPDRICADAPLAGNKRSEILSANREERRRIRDARNQTVGPPT
jgi:hypothetical protein